MKRFTCLLGLGVASLLDLLASGGGLLLREADAEHPEEEPVGGLDVGVGLDERLPLLDHGPQLVGGEVHAVKVGEAVLALHVLADQLELAEGPLGVVLAVEVGERDLVNAALETIGGDSVKGRRTFYFWLRLISFPLVLTNFELGAAD